MRAQGRGRTDSFELPPLAIPITSSIENSLADKGDAVDLSPRLRADLLDLDAWGEILTTYGRTMRAAVALTDTTVTYWGNVTMPSRSGLLFMTPHLIGPAAHFV